MSDQVSGFFSPYLRNCRMRAVKPYLSRGRVLDYGCGTGVLAEWVAVNRYLGVDADPASIRDAKKNHPQHAFVLPDELPEIYQADVIVALAFIEHVAKPAEWLRQMHGRLAEGGCIVLTTPHPIGRQLYQWGSGLRLFSQEAAEEHQAYWNHARLKLIAEQADLQIQRYTRFLLGFNQLLVLKRCGEK